MKGRKPRTPEQKAYIATRKELNKIAEKLNNLQTDYEYLLDEFATIEATLAADQLSVVEKIFTPKEVVVNVVADNTPVSEPVF